VFLFLISPLIFHISQKKYYQNVRELICHLNIIYLDSYNVSVESNMLKYFCSLRRLYRRVLLIPAAISRFIFTYRTIGCEIGSINDLNMLKN